MNDFQRTYPTIAKKLMNKITRQQKAPEQGWAHWLLLGLFGLLISVSFPWQLVVLLLLIGVTALVKGPLMLVYGAIYAFLVGLFPPLGILLSAILFILSLLELHKNWRFNCVAGFFYLYPLLIAGLHQFTSWNDHWLTIGGLAIGLLSLHVLTDWLYRNQLTSQALLWSIISTPYACLLFLLPKRFRQKLPKLRQKTPRL